MQKVVAYVMNVIMKHSVHFAVDVVQWNIW